jgi:hypothetical protein
MSSQLASRKIFFKGDKTRIELNIMMLQETASQELMKKVSQLRKKRGITS